MRDSQAAEKEWLIFSVSSQKDISSFELLSELLPAKDRGQTKILVSNW